MNSITAQSDVLLETEGGLLESNLQAETAETPTAFVFNSAVETVKIKSHDCHEKMKKRDILASEASFEFKGNTRAKRDAFISEVEEKVKLLYLELGDATADAKPKIEAEIRAQELIKVTLILEQAYADIAYALTRKELVAELSRKMVDAAQSRTISKGQIGNLLTEAKELQELYINIEIAAAESQQLISYFELEFKADSVPVLKNLSDAVELAANMTSQPGDPTREDFAVKYQYWRNQLGNKTLDNSIEILDELFAKMPEQINLDPTTDSLVGGGQANEQTSATHDFGYSKAEGWALPNVLGGNYAEVADGTSNSGLITTQELAASSPQTETANPRQTRNIRDIIQSVLTGLTESRAEPKSATDVKQPAA